MFLKRPGGQAQFSAALNLQRAEPRFDRLHDWIGGNLDHDLSAAALSTRAAMSERSFLRHYKSATGATPARTVERLRVESSTRTAQRYGTVDHQQIAGRVQSSDPEETMRRSFMRLLSVNPQTYRPSFSAANGSASGYIFGP